MTILGRGDLSPRRRHRSYGRVVLVLLLVAALGAGGYMAWRQLRGKGSSKATLSPICTTPTASPSPASATSVKVRILNATPQVGLAHRLGDLFTARGFTVVGVGNTAATGTGVATVGYPPGQLAGALAVAEQVPGAVVSAGVSSRKPVVIELDIGPDFRNLATPAQLAAARAHDEAAASPQPPVCTTPSP